MSRFFNIQSSKRTQIICPECNEKTCYDDPLPENMLGYNCTNCKSWHFTHESCCYDCGVVSLMTLLEHMNVGGPCDGQDTDLDPVTCDGDNYVVCTGDKYKDYESDTFIQYTKPTYKYDETTFGWLLGSDGGYPSKWKCAICGTIEELNDK